MPEEVTPGGPAVIALDNEGVVETIYGKVRGSRRDRIHILSDECHRFAPKFVDT
jgi:hypothetical protein